MLFLKGPAFEWKYAECVVVVVSTDYSMNEARKEDGIVG